MLGLQHFSLDVLIFLLVPSLPYNTNEYKEGQHCRGSLHHKYRGAFALIESLEDMYTIATICVSRAEDNTSDEYVLSVAILTLSLVFNISHLV